jgi:hypothetical protein
VCSFPNPLHQVLVGGTRSQSLTALEEACSQEYPESAFCVRRFDDSLNSAIRTTYRISLRSSSLPEPRYPLLRVVQHSVKSGLQRDGLYLKKRGFNSPIKGRLRRFVPERGKQRSLFDIPNSTAKSRIEQSFHSENLTFVWSSKLSLFSNKPTLRIRGDSTWIRVNDPSAGSPTETLLRLLLPLDDQVWVTSKSPKEGEPTRGNSP